MSGNWKSCKDFEEGVSESVKGHKHTICRIMDFEEPISKSVKKNGENLIRNCIKGSLHYA